MRTLRNNNNNNKSFCPWWLSWNGISLEFSKHHLESHILVPPASLKGDLASSAPSKPAWGTKLTSGFGFHVPHWRHPLSHGWTLWPHDNEPKIQLWSKEEGIKSWAPRGERTFENSWALRQMQRRQDKLAPPLTLPATFDYNRATNN